MERTETENDYLSDFERFERGTALNRPSWLPPLRKAAFSRFAEQGFPTRQDEEWRFTNITPITRTRFGVAGPEHGVTRERLARFTFGDLPGSRLVFVNGRFAPDLSSRPPLPRGARVESLAAALSADPRPDGARVEPHLARHAGFENYTFTALNTAFLEDGAFVHIPPGVAVEEPIHLLFVSAGGPSGHGPTGHGPAGRPTLSHPRTLIVARENSRATILESYVGVEEGVYLTNAVTEVVAAQGAVIDHYKLQRESAQAFHIANMQIRQERGSNFSSHSIALGGALVRNDVGAVLGGEDAECTLNGLYLATGQQLVDNHTAIDHAMPRCSSHEVYKGVLDGKARGVFNGKIFVRQDAQKTDAKQTNKTLLLSEDAQINTKPQLEIFADDVKCTHGATVGQLDEEQIFYLRARGIGKEDARSLLVYAFAGDIIGRIKVEPVRAPLDAALFAQLAKSRRTEEAAS